MPVASTTASATAAQSFLQKVAILATGNATNAGGLAYLESLVGVGNDYSALIDTVNNFMAHQAAMQGGAQVIQRMALEALGLALPLSDASALAQQIESGQQSWASLFVVCIEFANDWGQTLHNRAEAAQGFLANLQAAQKSSFFDGAAVFSAVKTLLQGVGASAASAASAQGSLSALAVNLHATGIQGVVVDGYLSGATVFIDSDGDGALSPSEWRTSTDASGNYLLPSNIGGSKLIALGGIDIMTGKPFQGVLTAPVGATVVTPLTTLAQALLDSGQASAAQGAASLVQQALGLPSIALLNYEPLDVLASSTASAADKAMALSVQKTAIQVANLIAQVGAAISAGSDVTALEAGNAAIAALASAMAANQRVDLADSAAVLGVVLGAASNAGIAQNATNLPLLARDVASIIAASNAATANAQNITQLAQSAVVAQSSAIAAIASGVAAGSLGSAVNGFTGAALDAQIKQATPGWINSGVPVPMPAAPVPPEPEPAPAPVPPAPAPPVVEPPATGGGSAPTITSVTVPAKGTYKKGDKLTFTLHTDEVVTVDAPMGAPKLALTIGSSAVQADYLSGSGSNALVFSYAVWADDVDTDGITVGALTLHGNSIKDAADNDLVLTLPSGIDATGILVDGVAPTLTSSLPADNADAVALDANLVLTFSENVKVGTGNIVIKKVSDQSVSEVETMPVGAAQVTLDGKVVTINPTADLTAGTAYYVEIADTAFTDMAGNAYAGISGATTLNFTTAADLVVNKDTQDLSSALSSYSGTNASVYATGMSAEQLKTIATHIAKIKTDGITGTFTINSEVSATDITSLLGKTASTAALTVASTGMDKVALSAVGGAMAKVDVLNFGSDQAVTADAAKVTGNTLSVTGLSHSQLILNGTGDADTINLTQVTAEGAEVVVTGLGGADTIQLGAGTFYLNYTGADDGGSTGDVVTGDVVTGFDSAKHRIFIGGNLKKSLGGSTDTEIASNGHSSLNFDLAKIAIGAVLEAANRDMYPGDMAVSATNLTDKGMVANLLSRAFMDFHGGVTSVDNSKVFAVQASDFETTKQFGVYVWTDTSDNPASVDATELQILGIFTGPFNADAILIA